MVATVLGGRSHRRVIWAWPAAGSGIHSELPRKPRCTRAQLHSSAGLARALGQSTILLGVVALCIGAAALASEYSTGTLRNLLVREPHRHLRLLGGMAVGVLTFIAAATVVALVVASGAAVAVASTKGIDTSAWLAPAGLGHVGRASLDLLASTLGFGLIGILLGVVLRSPVAAIGVGVAYALPVEAILSSTVNGIDRFLPGQLLGVLADGGTHAISYTSAGLTVLLYATVAVVGVGALFWRPARRPVKPAVPASARLTAKGRPPDVIPRTRLQQSGAPLAPSAALPSCRRPPGRRPARSSTVPATTFATVVGRGGRPLAFGLAFVPVLAAACGSSKTTTTAAGSSTTAASGSASATAYRGLPPEAR